MMEATENPSTLDRRYFILAAGALALLGAGGCARLKTNPPALEGDQYVFPFAAYPDLRQDGGLATAGPVKIGKYHGNVYIKRLAADKAVVLGARCRHLGCDVDWDPEEKLFVCPCHNSHYGPGGELRKGPARHPLYGWAARVESDRIVLAADASLMQS
jgi:Rieske Fe-S protein